MRQFATSGQSVRAFCAGRGLSEPSFYTWRRTLVARDAASSPTGASTPAFLPLRLAEGRTVAQSGDGGVMEIVLAGGRRIRLRGPVDRAALAEVVAALEPAP